MKYRRNADDRLRDLERAYKADPSANTLMAYNRARMRLGIEPIVAPNNLVLGPEGAINVLQTLWNPDCSPIRRSLEFRFLDGYGVRTQFPVMQIVKNILGKDYPTIAENNDQVNSIEQKMREAIPTMLDLGWVVLLQNCNSAVTLRIKRNRDYDEWIVQWVENKKVDEDKSYYTDNKEDAEITMLDMQSRIPKKYPVAYLLPKTIFQPSNNPIEPAIQVPGTLIADQWIVNEDPRTLKEPSLRRGSYPTKMIIYEKDFSPATAAYETRFVTSQCMYPYDTVNKTPNLNNGHYGLTWEAAKLNYLIRLLKLSTDCSYQLLDSA